MGVDFLAVAEAVAVGIVAVWVGFTGIDHRISVGILLAVGQTVAVGIIILGIGAQVTLLGVGQSIAVRIAEGPVGTVRGPGRGFPNRSVVVGVKAVGDLIGIRKTIVVAVPGSAGGHDKIVNEEVLVGSTHAGRDDEGEIIIALEGGGTDIGEVGVGVEAGGGEAGPVDRVPFDFNRTGDPLAIVENDTIGEGELPEIQTTHNPGDVDALLSVRIHPGVDLPGDVVLRMSSSHAFLGISLRAEDGITVVEGEAVGRRVATHGVVELVIKGGAEPRGGPFQCRNGKAGKAAAHVVDGELQAITLNAGRTAGNDRAISQVGGAVGVGKVLDVGTAAATVRDSGIATLVNLGPITGEVAVGVAIIGVGAGLTGINEGQAGILHAIREPITIGVDREGVGPGLGVADIDATPVLDIVGKIITVGVDVLGIGSQRLFLGIGQAVAVRIPEGPIRTVPGPGGRLANGSVVVGIKAVGFLVGIRETVPIAVRVTASSITGCDHQVVEDDV